MANHDISSHQFRAARAAILNRATRVERNGTLRFELSHEQATELNGLITRRLHSGRWRWCVCHRCHTVYWDWAYPEDQFTRLCPDCFASFRTRDTLAAQAEDEAAYFSNDGFKLERHTLAGGSE